MTTAWDLHKAFPEAEFVRASEKRRAVRLTNRARLDTDRHPRRRPQRNREWDGEGADCCDGQVRVVVDGFGYKEEFLITMQRPGERFKSLFVWQDLLKYY